MVNLQKISRTDKQRILNPSGAEMKHHTIITKHNGRNQAASLLRHGHLPTDQLLE